MKVPQKAFLKVCPKASEASRYSILTPWLAKVEGRWCWCATDGRAATMVPADGAEDAGLDSFPRGAIVAVPRETVEDGEDVRIVRKKKETDGKVAVAGRYWVENMAGTTERRCPEVTPPDLDGMMRGLSRDRMSVTVDAKVLLELVASLLHDVKGKDMGTVKSYIELSFARMQDGEGKIDDREPIIVKRDLGNGMGEARGLLMPVSSDAPQAKAKARTKEDRVANPSPSIPDADAEECVAIAREGGANA